MSAGEIKESYFDQEFRTEAVKIVAGEFYAGAEGVAVSTLLGSCVSVCLYDLGARVGGMNHFMLPELLDKGEAVPCPGICNRDARCCARYGTCAMRLLMQQLERLGASRGRLAAKLFGGARVMASSVDIGGKNAAFALDFLKQQGIPVMASDLGGCHPRKVMFFPATGRALVKRVSGMPPGNF